MGKKLLWSQGLEAAQTMYVWGLLAMGVAFHAIPGANKFDIIQSFAPFYVLVAFVILGVVLFGFLEWKKGGVKTPWPLIGFVIWSTLAFILAEVRTFGFAEIFVLWIGALLFLVFSAPKSRAMLRAHLPWFALLALGFHLVVGAYAFLHTDHLRFFGFFYNPQIKADAWPNAFASFFLLAFPLALAALSRIKKFDWLKGIVVGFLLAGFWMSFSRAGFIAFGLELVVLTLFFWKDLKPKKKLIVPIICMALALVGAVFFLQQAKSSTQETTDVSDRLTFSEAAGGTSVSERLEFFTGSAKLIAMDPIFGFGPVSFKSVYPQVQQGFLALSDHPHNILLKYAVERGLPAAIFFVVFLAMLLWRNSPFDKKAESLDRFVWAGIVGLMAHSMVDFNLNFFSIAMLWWLSLAMVGRLEKKGGNLFSLVLILLILAGAGYHAKPIYGSILPRWDLIGQINGLQDSNDFEQRKLIAQEQLSYDAFDHHALAELARIAVQEGRIDDAIASYELLLKVYPKNTFEYYVEYAKLVKNFGPSEKLDSLRVDMVPLLEEFRDLEARNVHFIQSKPEGQYADELEQILGLE